MRKRILAILFCLTLVAGLSDAQKQTFAVPLSNPGQPAILEASVMMGSISVVGYEGSDVKVEVIFEADGDDEGDEDEDSKGDRTGLRRIPSSSGGVTIEESDNKVEIGTDWSNEEVFMKIMVPFQTSVHLSGLNGDLVEVEGVTGNHELSHTNGEITALKMRGSVIANTTNGDVKIELLEADADKPMSFSSFNGDVEVILPVSINANLHMQTGQGDVYTDFDIEIQPSQPKVTQEHEGKGYRVRMEKAVEGTIGGGGPEFRFKTFNGDIILRRPQ
jgi:hypothetical protein